MEETIIETSEPIIEPTTPEIIEDTTTEVVEPQVNVEQLQEELTINKEVIDELIELADELENKALALEQSVQEKDASLTGMTEQLSTLNSEIAALNEALTELEKMKTDFSKIKEHETIGSIAQALLEGKEVNIPKYLEEYVMQELKAVPQFGSVPNPVAPAAQKTETLDSLIRKHRYF